MHHIEHMCRLLRLPPRATVAPGHSGTDDVSLRRIEGYDQTERISHLCSDPIVEREADPVIEAVHEHAHRPLGQSTGGHREGNRIFPPDLSLDEPPKDVDVTKGRWLPSPRVHVPVHEPDVLEDERSDSHLI